MSRGLVAAPAWNKIDKDMETHVWEHNMQGGSGVAGVSSLPGVLWGVETVSIVCVHMSLDVDIAPKVYKRWQLLQFMELVVSLEVEHKGTNNDSQLHCVGCGTGHDLRNVKQITQCGRNQKECRLMSMDDNSPQCFNFFNLLVAYGL